MLDNIAVALTLMLLLLAIFAAVLKIQYRQAGKRLLILSRFKWQRLILIILVTAVVIWGVYQNNAVLIYSFSAFGLNSWMLLLCPTELRKNGMIISGSFIRWSRIQSYQWQEQNSQHLLLKFQSKNKNQQWRIQIHQAKRSQVKQI